MKPPSTLFDDNFLQAQQPGVGMGGAGGWTGESQAALEHDRNLVKNIFGAQ